MAKLTPLNGHVILKPLEESEQMAGNIIIPDLGKEKPEIGEIIALSPSYNWYMGVEVSDHGIQVGDKVLIPKMGTQRITIENEEYYITKVTEIISKIN